RLRELGLWPVRQEAAVASVPAGPLAGRKILFTGSLSMPRSKAQQMAENAGAEIAGSVSRKLDLLVVGEEPGSKREKAQALGIRIVDEAGFLALLQADNEVAASSSESAAQDSE
ncbi:MAG: NAD-dependent DNA ligase LigA, partial [Bilophila sp.]|nr:NAD-dependent DNA ligase LigA [Bilophila sp.]